MMSGMIVTGACHRDRCSMKYPADGSDQPPDRLSVTVCSTSAPEDKASKQDISATPERQCVLNSIGRAPAAARTAERRFRAALGLMLPARSTSTSECTLQAAR